jgi:hypothetical protein
MGGVAKLKKRFGVSSRAGGWGKVKSGKGVESGGKLTVFPKKPPKEGVAWGNAEAKIGVRFVLNPNVIV